MKAQAGGELNMEKNKRLHTALKTVINSEIGGKYEQMYYKVKIK